MFVLVLALTTFIGRSLALHCYVCSSVEDPGCSHIVKGAEHSSKFYRECVGSDLAQAAQVQACYTFNATGAAFVSRGCAVHPVVFPKKCEEDLVGGAPGQKCYCHDDGCNGVAALSASLLVIVLLASAAVATLGSV